MDYENQTEDLGEDSSNSIANATKPSKHLARMHSVRPIPPPVL